MRKPQPVVMPKEQSNVLDLKESKLSKGHQDRLSSAGAHDSRPKRKRTRNAQRRDWMSE